jgi:hypothetical protein
MRGYLVVYDNVQQRIGWIRRNCHNRPTRMTSQFTSLFNWTNYLSQSILWPLKFVGYKTISGLIFWVSSQAVSLRFFLSLTMKDGLLAHSSYSIWHLFTWETLLLHLSCKSVVGHKKWHKYSEGDHMAFLGSSVSNHLWHLCHTYLFLRKPDYKRKRRLQGGDSIAWIILPWLTDLYLNQLRTCWW